MARRYKPKSECTPEEWEAYLAYQREWSRQNPDKKRAIWNRWKEKHLEEHLAKERARAKRNYRLKKERADANPT